MDNLDFINEDNAVNMTNVRGIINGNGHSLSNINLTGSAVLVNHLYGTFENIFINIVKQAQKYGMLNDEFFMDSTHRKANANKNKYEDQIVEQIKKRKLDLEDEINEERKWQFDYLKEEDVYVCSKIGIILPYKNIDKNGYKKYYDRKQCCEESKFRTIRRLVCEEVNE